MPILGIIASSKAVAVPNSYESIATVTVGSGGTSEINFTSIPATYTHLQLRIITGSNPGGYNSGLDSIVILGVITTGTQCMVQALLKAVLV